MAFHCNLENFPKSVQLLFFFFNSHQMQSELSDFHLDASHELSLLNALGDSYVRIGKYKEARKVMEEALIVCLKPGIDEYTRCAVVCGQLGWIYK